VTTIPAGQTGILAEFVTDLRYEDLPRSTVEHVKRIVLNIAAAALWGRRVEGGRQVAEVLKSFGGNAEAGVIGDKARLPAPHAAAIASAMAFATMSDDTHGPAQLHLGHALIPAALAEAERRAIGGREWIAAVAAAAEVAIRIAASVGPAQDTEHNSVRMGFWSEAKNAFGPTLVTARLRGLNAVETRHAIGIAATSSSGMVWPSGYRPPPHTESCGTVFAWDAAKPVIMGMTAARLAEAGMTAVHDSLEGAGLGSRLRRRSR
jgi:2-methylcitrate dehydratase PrpD